jgi:hypothetical protein
MVISTRHQTLLDQIEEGEMNDNCDSNGEKKCIPNLGWKI